MAAEEEAETEEASYERPAAAGRRLLPNCRGTPESPSPLQLPPNDAVTLRPTPLHLLLVLLLFDFEVDAGDGITDLGLFPGRDTSKSATLPACPPRASVAPSGVKHIAVVVAGSTAWSRGTNDATI